METAIKLENIFHRFTAHWALKDISFSISKGECVAVLGPNGCGKTTLLKILATRLAPTKGVGKILGWDMKKDTEPIRREIKWLGHDFGIYKTLTAEENLKFFFRINGKRLGQAELMSALEQVGLEAACHKRVSTFSTGMKKRLALAKILLEDPKIILLDESHANLDQEGKKMMNEMIADWKKAGVTILFSSHDHEEALSLCDRALMLNEGRLT